MIAYTNKNYWRHTVSFRTCSSQITVLKIQISWYLHKHPFQYAILKLRNKGFQIFITIGVEFIGKFCVTNLSRQNIFSNCCFSIFHFGRPKAQIFLRLSVKKMYAERIYINIKKWNVFFYIYSPIFFSYWVSGIMFEKFVKLGWMCVLNLLVLKPNYLCRLPMFCVISMLSYWYKANVFDTLSLWADKSLFQLLFTLFILTRWYASTYKEMI